MPYQRAANDAKPEVTDSLRSACSARRDVTRMTYTGLSAPISSEMDPVAAFTRMIAGATPGGWNDAKSPRTRRSRSEGINRKALVDILEA